MKCSAHLAGTTADADSWYLIQSSGMQYLSVLIVICSIWMRPDLSFEAWFWTWGFLGMAINCPAVAMLLYLYAPTEWSAVLSFVGTAVQGFVVLQSMFTPAKVKVKADWKSHTYRLELH
jgi:hypothetical protein